MAKKNTEPLGLPRNVTAENYAKLGKDFIEAHDNIGFVIALSNGERDGVKYSQTLKQWGAWLAFFKRSKVPHAFMLMREYYTVPAEWPHLFTSDSSLELDQETGRQFERKWFDAINDAPLRGTPPKPDKPRNMREMDKAEIRPRPPFRPFPKLWEAFANDVEMIAALDAGLPFETVNTISRVFATQGPVAARAVLFPQAAAPADVAPEIPPPDGNPSEGVSP